VISFNVERSFEKFGYNSLLEIFFTIGVQRKEIYSVIFEIKRVQFSIALLSTKPTIIRFDNPSITYRFPHYAGMYESFNFDSRKGILGGSFIQHVRVATRVYFYSSYSSYEKTRGIENTYF